MCTEARPKRGLFEPGPDDRHSKREHVQQTKPESNARGVVSMAAKDAMVLTSLVHLVVVPVLAVLSASRHTQEEGVLEQQPAIERDALIYLMRTQAAGYLVYS